MTSPSTTTGATPAPVYRCTSCGREFGAADYATFGKWLSHLSDATGKSATLCQGGTLEPIRRDQLVPVGAGDQLGQLDAGGGEDAALGHETNVATLAPVGHVNRTMAPGPSGSRTFTKERNHA